MREADGRWTRIYKGVFFVKGFFFPKFLVSFFRAPHLGARPQLPWQGWHCSSWHRTPGTPSQRESMPCFQPDKGRTEPSRCLQVRILLLKPISAWRGCPSSRSICPCACRLPTLNHSCSNPIWRPVVVVSVTRSALTLLFSSSCDKLPLLCNSKQSLSIYIYKDKKIYIYKYIKILYIF